MARIIPLGGTENNRKIALALGKLSTGEIHTTTQGRQWLKISGEDVCVGPAVIHGPVADEAEMLALKSSARGCRPGDWVLREDILPDPTYWQCISNEGELVTDWREDVQSNNDTLIDGGNFTETVATSSFDSDGGTFV